MDVFIEQIIAKRKEMKEMMLTALAIIAVPLLTFVSMFIPILGSFWLLVLLGLGYGAWWVISSMNLEFEYSVTNGDVTVDKIMGKRKRKRLISFDCKDVEQFGKYDPQAHQNRNYQTRIMAGSHPLSPGQWYFTLRHKKLGHTLVVIEPEDRVLNAIRGFLPRLIEMEAFKGIPAPKSGPKE